MPELELPNPDELDELRGKNFTKRVALTTAIFAVILAITSLGGNNAMKAMLLAQQQSSDQWAFYQAKAVREHLYRVEKARFELELLERGKSMKPNIRKQYESMVKKMGEEESRYRSEKKGIEQEAKKLEMERDINSSRDPYFDYAEVLLQIAIVMASISILSVSHPIFYFSIIAALSGSILTINGYFLIFNIPLFH